MNVAYFIARRIAFNKQKSFSKFIIRLATVATAISVAAMIVASAFVAGFQNAISNKIFCFWGHIHVSQNAVAQNFSDNEPPSNENNEILQLIKQNAEVQEAQAFADKSAVIEHNKDIEGIMFKGVSSTYDFKNMQQFLKQGTWINFSDSSYSKDIVISEPIANELNIKVNDTVHVYFVSSNENRANMRSMRVSGIYKTGIEEYDKLFAIGDIRLIQRINNWQHGEIDGFEVFLKDYKKMDKVSDELNKTLPPSWGSLTIKNIYPNIFDWLNIQDVNKVVIYVIMSIVAIINLITCLLILVLERMRMTGILKSLGANNNIIQRIFLYHSSMIAMRGVLYGLLFGVGLCLLQKYTGLLKLDESAYYIRIAPVEILWSQIIIICIASLLVCYAALLLPTIFITKIKPVKAIKFD